MAGEANEQFNYPDDPRLGLDGALGDRRAALDGLIGLISCLVGAALLLNGGALLVLISQSTVLGDAAAVGPFVFQLGILSALAAAALTAIHSVLLMGSANMSSRRRAQEGAHRKPGRPALLAILIGLSLASSFSFFGIGSTNALQRTAQARLDAQADASRTALTPEEIKRNKQDLGHAH